MLRHKAIAASARPTITLSMTMTAHPLAARPLAAPLSFAAPRPNLLARLGAALAVRHQRRQLAAMEAHRLADLGLTRAQALAEAERPMWNVPSHWLR